MVIAVAHPSVLLHKRDLGQDVHVCLQVCMCGYTTMVYVYDACDGSANTTVKVLNCSSETACVCSQSTVCDCTVCHASSRF